MIEGDYYVEMRACDLEESERERDDLRARLGEALEALKQCQAGMGYERNSERPNRPLWLAEVIAKLGAGR